MNALLAGGSVFAIFYFCLHVLPETQPFWLCFLLALYLLDFVDGVVRHASRADDARRAARRRARQERNQ